MQHVFLQNLKFIWNALPTLLPRTPGMGLSIVMGRKDRDTDSDKGRDRDGDNDKRGRDRDGDSNKG